MPIGSCLNELGFLYWSSAVLRTRFSFSTKHVYHFEPHHSLDSTMLKHIALFYSFTVNGIAVAVYCRINLETLSFQK